MYFWDIEALKKDITNSKLTDQQTLHYLIAFIGTYSITTAITAYLPCDPLQTQSAPNRLLSILSTTLLAIIPIAGTLYAYTKNGGSSGQDFLSKYFAIGFVVNVRLSAFLSIAVFIYVYACSSIALQFYSLQELAEAPTFHKFSESCLFFATATFILWSCIIYLSIGKHIEDTAKISQSTYKAPTASP